MNYIYADSYLIPKEMNGSHASAPHHHERSENEAEMSLPVTSLLHWMATGSSRG